MNKKKPQQHGKKHALTPEMKKRQWKKGISGNPGGRPKGLGLTDLLLREIEKRHPTNKSKKSWKQLIVEATMRLAIRGNATALKEIWERIDGKVALPIDVPNDITIIVSRSFKPKKSKRKSGEC